MHKINNSKTRSIPYRLLINDFEAESLLTGKSQAGIAFTIENAILDIVINMSNGERGTERYYAKRWGWTRHYVRKNLKEFREIAATRLDEMTLVRAMLRNQYRA